MCAPRSKPHQDLCLRPFTPHIFNTRPTKSLLVGIQYKVGKQNLMTLRTPSPTRPEQTYMNHNWYHDIEKANIIFKAR